MNTSDQKGSKTAILRALRVHGSLSRIDLTRQTGLSRATVSVCVGELIEGGIVQEQQDRQFSGGRPAVPLELAERSHAVLGAELYNNTWTIGAFDLPGNVMDSIRVPLPDSSPETAVAELAAALRRFVQRLGVPQLPLLGLCTPGLVDTERGVIHSVPLLDWHDVSLASLVKERTGQLPVILNRDRARGLLECRSRMERGYTNVVYVGIGAGIAACVYYKGELVTGALGGAGEIGHMTIEPDGPLCPCGNNGCLQLYGTESAIEQEARRLIRLDESERPSSLDAPGGHIQLLRAHDVCRASEAGDALAAVAVDKAAGYLGIALANIVNFYNPDLIVLGGTLPAASPRYVRTAAKVMRQRAMRPLADHTAVQTAAPNELGGALGAAHFALDRGLRYEDIIGERAE
ncbi:MAG: family transcriptional regulator [Paenibacillus sp.]|jgi:predicted NBD/HSP70 family sugar kinase|nr:family transcriptional regulator [Paenibacillus sp.]